MAEKDDADDLRRLLDSEWQLPENLSNEVRARIIALEREKEALSLRIQHLGARLAAGETEVRQELNPAIRRGIELGKELNRIRKEAGFRDLGAQTMYGPPWNMG